MLRRIDSLGEIAENYDVLLCDVWGVVHNGIDPFPLAVEALGAARERGLAVILVTNSPRPADAVLRQFDSIGVARDCFDDIVTSGDVTRGLVAEGPRRLFFLGPDRDRSLAEGIDVEFVSPEEAEGVLCTGFFDDETEGPEDYSDMLAAFRARDLPFICANPDQVVERGERIIFCAGALASAYEALGGKTRIAGKPHPPIYREALVRAERRRGPTEKSRVIAIGDGVATDMRGACDYGLDALFVARGIHANHYYAGRRVDEARLSAFLASEGVSPRYWTEWLC